jgi:hypothetical protein
MTRIEEIKNRAEKATIAPGYYVFGDGKVYSDNAWRGYGWRELKAVPNSHGYLRVRIMTQEGKRISAFVHKLVANAFLEPRPSPDHQIRHLDGNRTNNVVTNLAWGTAKENAQDRTLHGRSRGADNGKKSAWKLRGVPKSTFRRARNG